MKKQFVHHLFVIPAKLGIQKTFRLTAQYSLVIVPLLFSSPSTYAQSFDSLLNELSGSEADQLESENADDKKKDSQPSQPSSTEINSSLEEDEFAPEKTIVTKSVILQGLDKQTARVFIIEAPINKPIEFGTLKILVHHCEKAPLEDRQESIAFLTISEQKPESEAKKLFSGWMFASSPALSSLDHPVYDVWVKECKGLH